MFWYYEVLIAVFFLSVLAQILVWTRFARYSKVHARSGYTGVEAARRVLDEQGLYNVRVEHVRGTLSDHFSPNEHVLRLSDATYGSSSVSALSVSMHEVGHALQQRDRYPFNAIRGALVPAANAGSLVGPYLVLLGLFIPGDTGSLFLNIGTVLYGAAVVFYFVTLPVEFNASKRALAMLDQTGILSPDELPYAQKVLSAAALTYVAAASGSLLNFFRFLLLSRVRRR